MLDEEPVGKPAAIGEIDVFQPVTIDIRHRDPVPAAHLYSKEALDTCHPVIDTSAHLLDFGHPGPDHETGGIHQAARNGSQAFLVAAGLDRPQGRILAGAPGRLPDRVHLESFIGEVDVEFGGGGPLGQVDADNLDFGELCRLRGKPPAQLLERFAQGAPVTSDHGGPVYRKCRAPAEFRPFESGQPIGNRIFPLPLRFLTFQVALHDGEALVGSGREGLHFPVTEVFRGDQLFPCAVFPGRGLTRTGTLAGRRFLLVTTTHQRQDCSKKNAGDDDKPHDGEGSCIEHP